MKELESLVSRFADEFVTGGNLVVVRTVQQTQMMMRVIHHRHSGPRPWTYNSTIL